ncbi:MAG: hypothetical protein QOG55_2861 [Acidobacteriaceae bacterium]|jgi:hypothetical protein|nr:hypothetical protein [Acidobacteriaceae bacterium]
MAHQFMIVSPLNLPWPVRSFRYAWTGPASTFFWSSPVSSSEGFCRFTFALKKEKRRQREMDQFGDKPYTLISEAVPTYTLPFATVGTVNFTAGPA